MNHPDFATSYQVRTTAQSGIVLIVDTSAERTVLAPLTCEEAERMAAELTKAIKIFKDAAAVESFIQEVPAAMAESQLVRD